MRSFLRKVWRSTASEEPFASANAVELATELHERVREAETEWKRIDRDLLKWFGSEFAVGALALGPAIAAGGAEWAAGGVAVAGVTNLIVAQKKRAEHKVRYPAAFFVRLRDRQSAE